MEGHPGVSLRLSSMVMPQATPHDSESYEIRKYKDLRLSHNSSGADRQLRRQVGFMAYGPLAICRGPSAFPHRHEDQSPGALTWCEVWCHTNPKTPKGLWVCALPP